MTDLSYTTILKVVLFPAKALTGVCQLLVHDLNLAQMVMHVAVHVSVGEHQSSVCSVWCAK